jgi:acyl carrier protein
MADLGRMRSLLRDTLQIGERADDLNENSRLFGAIPEFDSVAIISVVMAIEAEYGVKIPDRELSADVFETLGSLDKFVSHKVSSSRADG